MPRFLTGVTQKGLIQSIQQIASSALSNNNCTGGTISAVVINNSVIIINGQFNSI